MILPGDIARHLQATLCSKHDDQPMFYTIFRKVIIEIG